MASLAGGKVCWQREDGDLLHTLWSEGGIGWRLSCLRYKRLGGRKIILVPSFIISNPKMTFCACHNVGNEKLFIVWVISGFWTEQLSLKVYRTNDYVSFYYHTFIENNKQTNLLFSGLIICDN